MFSFLYNGWALLAVSVVLFGALVIHIGYALKVPALRPVFLWCGWLLTLATCVRLLCWQRGVIRTAQPLLNLNQFPYLFYSDLKYPLAFGSLVGGLNEVFPVEGPPYAAAFGVLLVLGSLTPLCVYLVAREVVEDDRLAVTAGMMVALSPLHVLFSVHYDFYAVSVFYDAITQLFLLRYLRARRLGDLVTFAIASYLFCNSRVENHTVFYLNTLMVMLAARKATTVRLAPVAVFIVYVCAHLMVQWDVTHSSLMGQHVIKNLLFAPLHLPGMLLEPHWNHFIDFRFSPPYLLPLIIVGLYAAARRPSIVQRYEALVLVCMLMIYTDITDSTILWNGRYFLNLLPVAVVVATVGLEAVSKRWPFLPRAAPWIVAVSFIPYLRTVAHFDYVTQDEYRFYRDEVRPRLPRDVAVWKLRIDTQLFRDEFRDEHLFEMDRHRVVYDPEALASGDMLFLGINCYQTLDRPIPMQPECAAQLHDPRNVVVLHRRVPARPYHIRALWYVTGVWRSFQYVDFYLLRRR